MLESGGMWKAGGKQGDIIVKSDTKLRFNMKMISKLYWQILILW